MWWDRKGDAMTDRGNWPSLIRRQDHYIMIPINAYQMGNLIGALVQVQDNGDWWGELQDIIAKAMEIAELEHLYSNNNRIFTRKQIAMRQIR